MPELSIIIPVYNEHETIPELVGRLLKTAVLLNISCEMLFVDDGSTDQTPALLYEYAAKDMRIKIISFSRNFGHQAAVSAGLTYARGNAIAVMDGDLQDPPEFLPSLYALYKEGNDVVYAVRTSRKEGFIKRCAYFLFYRIARATGDGIALPLHAGDFSLMSRRVVDHINRFPERGRYVRGLRSWVGFRQVGLSYERDERHDGVSKYSIFKLFRLAYDCFFGFTRLPLLIINVLAFVFSLLSCLGIAVIFGLRLFTHAYIPGFASTAILILFTGGIQLFMLGIVGEYMKRLYDEVRQRPLYLVDKKINFDRES
ncbi:MAG: glycosyltransferase family 2 protein [Candidatus Sungbacteria bacterium]|nr:glycosyltransferase family 2 protein [Candidatus Sungbacteria bacterium]